MEPSLQHTLARRRTPPKWASHHIAIVQLLEIDGHMILLAFFVDKLFHLLTGRNSPVAQADSTVLSSGKRPTIHRGSILNWKHLGAVQMDLAVLLPFERAKDPLVIKETQLALLGKILFVARRDMLSSLHGQVPKMVQIHPFS
jgi:hypothetical protein